MITEDYYEDDVVIYTQSGKHPIIPEHYKYCNNIRTRHNHLFKSFYSEQHATFSLKYAATVFPNDSKIFKCPLCGFYHITTDKNYKKIINKYHEYKFK